MFNLKTKINEKHNFNTGRKSVVDIEDNR
jgi:hypothetical protein